MEDGRQVPMDEACRKGGVKRSPHGTKSPRPKAAQTKSAGSPYVQVGDGRNSLSVRTAGGRHSLYGGNEVRRKNAI